jgi:hypothetical protein
MSEKTDSTDQSDELIRLVTVITGQRPGKQYKAPLTRVKRESIYPSAG